jgi:hypothetical protein
MKQLIEKLKEQSTWAGLATTAALAGLVLSPEQWGAISTAVIAVIAVWEIFRHES